MALILMRFQISNLVKEYKLIKNIKNAGHIIFCPAKFRHGEKYMGSKEKALTAAIILAGGKGSRMQSEIPKQYMKMREYGRRNVSWSTVNGGFTK